MYDFIAAYFLFLPIYPLAVIENFSRGWELSVIWIAVAIVVIFVSTKFNYRLFRKIFISIWLMPGTIVCGAAAIAPWPLTVPYMFYDGGCATIISALVTLLFNFLIVFGCIKLINKLKKKHARA